MTDTKIDHPLPVGQLARWLAQRGGRWRGSVKALLAETDELHSLVGWPHDPVMLYRALRRDGTRLEEAGVHAKLARERNGSEWVLTSVPPDPPPEPVLVSLASANGLIIQYHGQDGVTYAEPALALGLLKHHDGRTQIVPINEELGVLGSALDGEWALDRTVSVVTREFMNPDVTWLVGDG